MDVDNNVEDDVVGDGNNIELIDEYVPGGNGDDGDENDEDVDEDLGESVELTENGSVEVEQVEELTSVPLDERAVFQLSLSSDGARLASGCEDDSVSVFDLNTGSTVTSLRVVISQRPLFISAVLDKIAPSKHVQSLLSACYLKHCPKQSRFRRDYLDFKDSVTEVHFSPVEPNTLAAGDMSGTIRVYDAATPSAAPLAEWETGSDLNWMDWHPKVKGILLAADAAGSLWMWRLSDGQCKVFAGGPSCACTCAEAVTVSVGHIWLGYADGSEWLVDLRSMSSAFSSSAAAKLQSRPSETELDHVNCLAQLNTSQASSVSCIMGSGCLSGHMSWHSVSRSESADGTTADFSSKHLMTVSLGDSPVESLRFSRRLPYLAIGQLSGQLNVWDIPTQTCRLSWLSEAGITKLCWADDSQNDRSSSVEGRELPLSSCFFSAHIDGCVRLFDVRANSAGQCVRCWKCHNDEVLDFFFIRGKLFTCSGDGLSRVFDVE